MKRETYLCDACTNEIDKNTIGKMITLTGYSNAGLLLPASLITRHFHDKSCFESWMRDQLQSKAVLPANKETR